MSFSYDIKNEVTRLENTNLEYIAELSAIIRNNADISKGILITIENNAVARRIFKLFKSIYQVTPIITVRKRFNFNKGLSYILEINQKKDIILEDLSIVDSTFNYLVIPKDYIIGDDDLIKAYLRGLFLATGSINDPKTSRYHLEFMVDSLEYAEFIQGLLNDNDLNSRIIRREKNYMVYIKEAEKISDFLRMIKAFNAIMYYEDIRIYRDHKNMTNRLDNCEQANMDKVFLTSSNQIRGIEVLKKNDMLDLLDEKIKEVIEYRLKYPESSLQELSEIISKETGKNISKSGLNHRFRKIKELANSIERR